LTGEKGKPYFKDGQKDENAGNIHFSISHSGDYWICAVGRLRIGADIQEVKPAGNMAVAKRFFHPAEYEYLVKNKEKGFFDIWTAKESYVKYTGTGISNDFSKFSVIDENEKFVREINGTEIRFIDFEAAKEEYKLCVCSENISSVEMRQIVNE